MCVGGFGGWLHLRVPSLHLGCADARTHQRAENHCQGGNDSISPPFTSVGRKYVGLTRTRTVSVPASTPTCGAGRHPSRPGPSSTRIFALPALLDRRTRVHAAAHERARVARAYARIPAADPRTCPRPPPTLSLPPPAGYPVRLPCSERIGRIEQKGRIESPCVTGGSSPRALREDRVPVR
jgi:hypothetical protein